MRAYLALSIAAVLVGAVRSDCDVCMDGRCYRKHSLPYSGELLTIDRNRQIMYYKQGNTIQACQLDQDHCNGTDIAAHFSILDITVDQRTGDTYCHIHDSDGESLYKADFVNNDLELLVRGGVNYITFRDKLYYSTDGGIYTFERGESRLVAGSEGQNRVFTIVVDKWNDIYFTTHLNRNYVIRRLSKGVVDQDLYWAGSYLITDDRDGNAVFIDPDSHVVYRVTNGKQAEVGAIKDLIDGYNSHVTPVFDRENNIIYSTGRINYYHLKQEEDMHVYCTTSIILGYRRIITEIISTTPVNDNVETTPRSSTDESGASDSAIPGPQPHTEQQSRCNCPKLPNISVKVEFN